MGALLAREGYTADRVARLDAALPLLESGGVRALFLAAGPLAASDVLLLRRIREAAPATALVVVTMAPTDPDIKRAFESGATAFLSWPASKAALQQAMDRAGRSPQ
jgi:DNA-binding NarL/FixJ family response regulator